MHHPTTMLTNSSNQLIEPATLIGVRFLMDFFFVSVGSLFFVGCLLRVALRCPHMLPTQEDTRLFRSVAPLPFHRNWRRYSTTLIAGVRKRIDARVPVRSSSLNPWLMNTRSGSRTNQENILNKISEAMHVVVRTTTDETTDLDQLHPCFV